MRLQKGLFLACMRAYRSLFVANQCRHTKLGRLANTFVSFFGKAAAKRFVLYISFIQQFRCVDKQCLRVSPPNDCGAAPCPPAMQCVNGRCLDPTAVAITMCANCDPLTSICHTGCLDVGTAGACVAPSCNTLGATSYCAQWCEVRPAAAVSRHVLNECSGRCPEILHDVKRWWVWEESMGSVECHTNKGNFPSPATIVSDGRRSVHLALTTFFGKR